MREPLAGAREQLRQRRRQRRLVPKPPWLTHFEQRIAGHIPLHPNVISAAKLVVVTPLMLLGLRQLDTLPHIPLLIGLLFAAFALLDYLDGAVARARGLATHFGRVFDRVTDYPLLVFLSAFCVDVLPLSLLALKLSFDLALLVLYAVGRGSTENRLRTMMSYSTLGALLALSQGWWPRLVSVELVQLLLVVNVVFTGLVMLHNLDLLQKRFVADLLSLCNLVCGTLAMWAASRGAFEVSLLWLLLGAGFDGFDGAAARRWGGTRWGVYSDDLADAVNFACAPAAVLWFGVAGAEGVALALCFALFTIGRLVFFTLNKGAADPRYFNGVPSTVGAIMAVTSVILFRQQAALVGLFVGIACAQMVAFDTLHRHVGRALASQPKLLLASPLSLALLAALAAVFGPRGPVTLLLAVSIGYGLAPCVLRFRRAGRAWRRRHADDAGALSGAA